MAELTPGTTLWKPPTDVRARSAIGRYLDWLERDRGETFADYHALWAFSVEQVEAFWESLFRYFSLRTSAPYTRVLSSRTMPGARWFAGAQLNYAEHALQTQGTHPAVIFRREDGSGGELSWDALHEQVARARAGLRKLGVQKGDRVAAYLPNGPEAVIAFLASASLGATWSSCSPEFGVQSVLDRLRQIEPKVLLAVDGYEYGGKRFERLTATREIAAALPSLRATVMVPRLGLDSAQVGSPFSALLAEHEPLAFEPCDFDHPLWILYSSGTTGLPKAIVQGHGGILLEHLKALSLHCDLGPGSRFFWFTTTGWMMWNFLVSGLTVGATIVLYEGNPAHPEPATLFRYAGDAAITYFGTSAPFLIACQKQGLRPGDTFDLRSLRALGSTGAPLPLAGAAWVYDAIKPDLQLADISGGTDVCTAFIASTVLLPVVAGEMQCRALGAKVEAYDLDGRPLREGIGELVITEPMPSMPLYFLNDPDGARLRSSYFAEYPGIWRHGDFLELTPRGGAIIYGRSDSTMNRGGIRTGTAELYRVVEALPEIADSVVVDTSALHREGELWLFVVPAAGVTFSPALAETLRGAIRRELSPRHVPDHVLSIAEVPRTLNGKKLEVPIKRILTGSPPERVLAPGTLQNPQAVEALLRAVHELRAR